MKFVSCPKQVEAVEHLDCGTSTESLKIIFRWIHHYLCGPYPPELTISNSRPAPARVCSPTFMALQSLGVWVAVVGCKAADQEIDDYIFQAKTFLLSHVDMCDVEDVYKTAILVFPELNNEVGYRQIEAAHRRMKSPLVAAGLMLGQFYATCSVPSIIDPMLMPLRAPLPLLAVRRMVEGDRPFLQDDPAWLASYAERFSRP